MIEPNQLLQTYIRQYQAASKKKTKNFAIRCESLQAFPGNAKQGVRKKKNMVRYRTKRK